LALLALERPNLLLLDEPTNHLDLPSREALEAVLADFEGTIVFVSHDRYFIDRLATSLWVIADGQLLVVLGNYSDYQRAQQRKESPPRLPETQRRTVAPPTTRRSRSPRQVERELAQVERTIEELEARTRALAEDLDEATARQDVESIAALGATYEALAQELERAYARWEELQEELATIRIGNET
jgi:ATP-binding cassette subfamily F protein 3